MDIPTGKTAGDTGSNGERAADGAAKRGAVAGAGAKPASTPFAFAGGYAPQCEGVHALYRDAHGRITARLAAELAGSPTWLHLSADGRCLQVLLEEAGALVSFAVDPDGALSLIARHAVGALPVHLDLDPLSREAWIAHYGDGTLRRVPLTPTGEPGPVDLTIAPRAGAEPHAHMVRRHPRWPLLLASDLGQDLLRVWRLDAGGQASSVASTAPASTPSHPSATTGQPIPVELTGLALPPGSGPRHFVFHPRDDRQLYLLNEQANALDWMGLDESGGLTHRARLSSLPAGFEGLSYASDLLVSPDGRRLFALNRLHDAIAVFDLDEQGRPTWAGEVWAQGSYPRSATFSPDGRELWVCLQRSHQVCVFALDPLDASDKAAGRPAPLPRFDGHFIAMPGAACVVFR